MSRDHAKGGLHKPGAAGGGSFAGSFRALGFAVGPVTAPGPATHVPSRTPRSSPSRTTLCRASPRPIPRRVGPGREPRDGVRAKLPTPSCGAGVTGRSPKGRNGNPTGSSRSTPPTRRAFRVMARLQHPMSAGVETGRQASENRSFRDAELWRLHPGYGDPHHKHAPGATGGFIAPAPDRPGAPSPGSTKPLDPPLDKSVPGCRFCRPALNLR